MRAWPLSTARQRPLRIRHPSIPQAQGPMIGGMVSKLATRLASNAGSIDEWSRLIRAYTVLHEADKAKAALVDAHKALASDANAVASLDGLAHDLGTGDAN
jgi:cytochrome c-type biogenesis protein CcmH